jgi:hypothetical protein
MKEMVPGRWQQKLAAERYLAWEGQGLKTEEVANL